MPQQKNNIDKTKEALLKELGENITDMSSTMYEVIVEQMERELEISGGKIVTDKNFVDKLNKLIDQSIKSVQRSPKFGGVIGKFVKRLDAVSNEISKFQKLRNKIDVPAYTAAKKVVIDEIIESMLDRGLNQHFAQPLRDLIYRNATGQGLSLREARELIKKYIGSGQDQSGKLKSYMEQTAQQAVDLYSGMINKKLMETFDYNAMVVTGTLIDNSAPQCVYSVDNLNGIIKRTDWPKVKDKATKKAPIIEGTTFENLPIMLLHWGCRHGFYPINV